ncbi:MAG: hypothetical protein IJM79_01615 [Erysipelotrichaceae bacterium]|nr:hypothetical protein [Erysipelotrichaceae bacterium]
MKESLYLAGETVIVNLSSRFYNSTEEIVSSDGFAVFLERYFKELAVRDIRVYRWLTNGRPLEEMVPSLIELTKSLLIAPAGRGRPQEMSELDCMKALYIVEDCYRSWRSRSRFTVISGNRADALAENFGEYDEKYSSLIRQLYRSCLEKLSGRAEKVIRETSGGTSGSCLLTKYRIRLPRGYASLRNIPFVARLLLKTPLMMDFDGAEDNIRPISLTANPLASFKLDSRDYYCLPLKVADLLCLTYFHKDYLAQAVCLANLFELAGENDCLEKKADLICLFGLPSDSQQIGYYHDVKNGIHLAAVYRNYRDESFVSIRNAILTLHDLAQLDRGRLPVRGSMMDIFFRDDSRKSLLLLGETGAGKSETLEALRSLSDEVRSDKTVKRLEVVFDGVGSLKIADGQVVANGSETGGFERIGNLSQSVVRDVEKGIFINMQKPDAMVILPFSGYETVRADHRVDMVLYANNYENTAGVERFADYEDCRSCLIEGKRVIRDDEGREMLVSGSPMKFCLTRQQSESYLSIMDEIFGRLLENGVFTGQLYTNLATDHPGNLRESARCLWELLRQQPN